MADYKRSIKCSGCGNEITVYMNGNFDLMQLSASGKCPDCKNTIQVDFAMVEKEEPVEIQETESMEAAPLDMFSTHEEQQSEPVEEEEKPEEETSDIIRDLIKD